MRLQRKFKIALISALAVMFLATIAGIAAFGLTLIRDTTEDTPIEIVGDTAGTAVGPVTVMGSAAPSSPLEPHQATANQLADNSAPSAPASVSASRTSGSVAVSWSSVTNADSYDAQYREGTSTTTPWSDLASATTDTSATLSGATDSSSYTFRVRATNQHGSSDWKSSGTIAPFIPTPSSVSGHQQTEVWQVTALWNQPTGIADTTTYKYDIEFSDDSGSTWFGCKTGENVTTDSRCKDGEDSYSVTPPTVISIEVPIQLNKRINRVRIRTVDSNKNVSAWVDSYVDEQFG